MDEELELEEIADAEDDEAEPVVGELASIEKDWGVVIAMLPAQWENKAVELGAVRRQLRGFDSVASLLRVLLIHLADGCSLRETAARASAGGLAEVSDVALLKRLRGCGAWFEWMTREMAAEMALTLSAQSQLPSRRLRLVDGSSICEPGATGSTWRLHYALNLHTLSCDEVHVTEASVGETLELLDIRAGDVIMADRNFARPPNLRYALRRQADVVLRTNLTSVPLHDEQGARLDLLSKLGSLSIGQAAEWPACMKDKAGDIALRVCAYKKTAAQTLKAQQAVAKEARKKGRNVRPQTLQAAGYVIVLTTLAQPDAVSIMELYRQRWQIELAFKRLKSLLQLGHLKKFDQEGARAWLQGKILVACLIEKLILTAERFSPWGYLAAARPEARAPLALA